MCAAYKSSSDAFVDANVQLAIASARLVSPMVSERAHSAEHMCRDLHGVRGTQLAEQTGKRVHIVVPDEGEYNRSFRMCAPPPPPLALIHAGCACPSMLPVRL